jgi:NADPH-dependent 2,4-dienoyl-CoA reductase/sulfur reductase-like enzyme
MRCLIIGNGPAGIAAAKAFREREPGADVVILGEESGGPYLRPFLADLLSGEKSVEQLADPQAAELGGKRIVVRSGVQVARLDTTAKTAVLAGGTEERYDVLLVATGGKPVVPHPLHHFLDKVMPVDSLENMIRLRERAALPGTVAVYGPGFLAAVTARALRALGKDVVWLKSGSQRAGNPIGGRVDAELLAAARGKGILILDGADIVEAHGEGDGLTITPGNGVEPLRVATVAVATERQPNTAFLRGSGIEVGTGVLVDDTLRTNVANVFAAGDCAELYDRTTHESLVNFGWRSAFEQGRLAGENMAGAGKAYLRTRDDYFWRLFGPPLRDRFR